MPRPRPLPLLAAILCLLAPLGRGAVAAPLAADAIPEPLRPWARWVLHDLPQAECPYLQGSSYERRCLWPSALTLVVGERGGTFDQRWQVHEAGWAPLPGDARRWPQAVTVDGAPAVVVTRGGLPGLELTSGFHQVRGEFAWDSLPEQLRVPPETGLLDLELAGKRVAAPQRDAGGVLWLHRRAQEGAEANRLDLVVSRRITDTIPLVVTTQVDVQAAGKNREVLLGRALLTGFVPMAVRSELPVRLEPDGRLRAQVRPGRWTITVESHYDAAITALPLEAGEGPWAEEEVWVFDAQPELRRVEIGGLVAVDPQQTQLPEDWKSLPAFRVVPGATMLLTETHRGEVDRGADRLTLRREWWLDFDGQGLTIRDAITGDVRQASRLAINAPARLGRVSAAGKDQFITHLDDPERPGVELRQRSLDLRAESRAPMAAELSAVDWDADFHAVSGTLNLPPGWRLFHVAGADDVGESWLERWDLLEIFLVLIIAIAVARLYGAAWGVLAVLTLTLVFPESMAPRAVWLFVLAGEGLLRVLPPGRLAALVRAYRLAARVALVGVTVGFAVQQVRQGLYPALEDRYDRSDLGGLGGLFLLGAAKEADFAMAPTAAAPPPIDAYGGQDFDNAVDGEFARAEPMQQAEQEESSGKRSDKASSYTIQSKSSMIQAAQKQKKLREYDASTVIQTGPGVPEWSWRSIRLSWSGPVERGQRIHLYLIPPALNLILAFVRVLLAALLALVVVGALGRRRPAPPAAPVKAAPRGAGGAAGRAAALLLPLVLGAAALAPREARADIPSPELLDQLRARLVETPRCLPECATIPRLRLTVTPDAVRMHLEIHAAADIAVPLPGNAAQWLPTVVAVDDPAAAQTARGLARAADGVLWLDLPAGRHDVVLEGPLPARETVQLAFPLPPRRVEAVANGWTIDGLHEDGLADPDLQLTRLHSEEKGAESLEMGPLPPLVRVERELDLGLTWEVTTRVVRITPPGAAVVLTVPLLAGESVTTAELRVDDGKVQVNMPPDALEASWTSVLEIGGELALRAAERQPWVEVWRLQVGPVWHVESAGIPVIRQGDGGLREWRPWPGESVELSVRRPQGIDGQTLTLDRARLDLRPGLRATDATLSVDLRSSRGGHHDLTLPEGAKLQSVVINGVDQAIGQTGQSVRVPVVPGTQSLALTWREPVLLDSTYVAPAVHLGAPAVNVSVGVDFPYDRWILWVTGPRLGPAVLFWSYIVMLVLAALVLGQIRWTPLRHHQWFLLGLGLSPLPVPAAMLVVGWLLVLGWRRRTPDLSAGWFNLRQLMIAGWTFGALIALIAAITAGLLGQPDMQIEGNGSYDRTLQWFQDRSDGGVARPTVLSVSIWWYRGLMLAWALWLAWSLIRWLPWVWQGFSSGGYWKKSSLHWVHHIRPRAGEAERAGVAHAGSGDPWVPAPQVGVRPSAAAPSAGSPSAAAPASGPAQASAPHVGVRSAEPPSAAAPAAAPAPAATPRPAGFVPPHLRGRSTPPPLAPKGTVIPERLRSRVDGDDPEA